MVRCHAGAAKGCVMSPLLFNMFFAAVIHVILVRFSDDKEIVRDLFHLEGAVAVNKVSMACVRMEFWGMLYADDAGIVSRSNFLVSSVFLQSHTTNSSNRTRRTACRLLIVRDERQTVP